MRSQVELDAIVAGLRDAHRELNSRLTNRTIARVLAREGIPRRPAKIPAAAMTVMQYGRAAIVVNPDRIRNPREEVAVLAEEYAHAKLHAGDPGEVVVHVSSRATDDPREYEADYVARCLIEGPGVEVPYFQPQKQKGPRVATQPQVPIVGPLEDPYETHRPVGGPRTREPRYGPRRPLPKGTLRPGASIFKARTFAPDRVDPNGFTERTPERTRYTHPDFGQWTVWDIAWFTVDGERRKFTLTAGQTDAAITRVFVAKDGTVRRYTFTRWEPRLFDAKHLERQIRQATAPRIPPAPQPTPQEKTG